MKIEFGFNHDGNECKVKHGRICNDFRTALLSTEDLMLLHEKQLS